MPRSSINASILSEASKWVVHHSSPQQDETSQAEFDAWRQADPRHEQAYTQLSRLWGQLGETDPSRLKRKIARKRTQRVAAMALLAGAVTWAMLPSAQHESVLASTTQIRQLVLADGSRITLDADSVIDARIDGTQRTVTLIKGRAMFDVAPSRDDAALPPFTVQTPHVSATALGTRFDVQYREDATNVAVYEHKVQVTCLPCAGQPSVILEPGDQIQTTGEALSVTQDKASPAWEHGMLTIDNLSLGQVTVQLQRYTQKRIVLLSPAARRLRVSGTVNTRDAAAAMEWLLTHSNYQVQQLPGLIIIR